ncbi:MAG: hypothetical protein IIA41_03260 [SAR324 cluster bacterium]|nr:hypothetical protein [SAR324 cluster bacterium]
MQISFSVAGAGWYVGTSAEIDADCTLQAYRQLPTGDGSFRLEPIGGALIGEPPP